MAETRTDKLTFAKRRTVTITIRERSVVANAKDAETVTALIEAMERLGYDMLSLETVDG